MRVPHRTLQGTRMKVCQSLMAVGFGLALTSCESLNQPLVDSGSGYDPLRSPGASFRPGPGSDYVPGPTFSPGSFAEASLPDTAFFRRQPKGNAKADMLLKRGESVKVIGMSDSYVKAELSDGSIGFIPAIMLEEPRSSNAVVVAGTGSNRGTPSYVSETIPDLPPPIEDPGNPEDLEILPTPNLSDNSPILPLPDIEDAPDIPELEEAATPAPAAPKLSDTLPNPIADEPSLVDDIPPLPEPAQ